MRHILVWIAVFILGCIVLYSFVAIFSLQNGETNLFSPTLINLRNNCKVEGYEKFFEERRECLSASTKKTEDLWYNLPAIVSECIDPVILTEFFEIKALENWDEQKIVITPVSVYVNSDNFRGICSVVSLGIGGDIQAERQLRVYQPECEFYGADPIRQAGTVYLRIGKFFLLAIR